MQSGKKVVGANVVLLCLNVGLWVGVGLIDAKEGRPHDSYLDGAICLLIVLLSAYVLNAKILVGAKRGMPWIAIVLAVLHLVVFVYVFAYLSIIIQVSTGEGL